VAEAIARLGTAGGRPGSLIPGDALSAAESE
jgi:hypothetical protein